MNVNNRLPRFVGLVTIIVVALIILFILIKIFSYVSEPKEEVQNTDFKEDSLSLNIKGDFITYLEINSEYKEEGAKAYFDDENVSDLVVVSYYKDDHQVSGIDTDKTQIYKVKYEILIDDKYKSVTKIVVVTDTKAPKLVMPDTVTITSLQVSGFDVENGVIATDNSGTVNYECENTLSEKPGSYVIKCKAYDNSGNVTSKNRLIKVINE